MKNLIIFLYLSILTGFSVEAQNVSLVFADHNQKKAVIPPFEMTSFKPQNTNVLVRIDASVKIAEVSKYIYGINAGIYMNDFTKDPVLLNYIKDLSPTVIRYPGGDVTNLFFWDSKDKTTVKDVPNALVYTKSETEERSSKQTYWHGFTASNKRLSVDKYYSFLKEINATGIIGVNYAYARYGLSTDPVATAAHYAANWVRYDNGRTKFWEIGNENYGAWEPGYKIDTKLNKDNQPEIISGTLYGRQANVFIDSMKAAARQLGNTIYIGIQLTEHSTKANTPYKTWNDEVLKEAGNNADFFILHSYYTPQGKNSPSDEILNSAVNVTPRMVNFIKNSCAQAGVPLKPLALTEWNIFAVHSQQATSYINGMHAALVLGQLAKYNIGLATRWSLINGSKDPGEDKGMFSRATDPRYPESTPYPPFYYIYFFQKFFGDQMISSKVDGNQDIIAYASLFNSGEVGIVLINKGVKDQNVRIDIDHFQKGNNYYWYSLTGGSDKEFSQDIYINNKKITSTNPSLYKNIKAFAAKAGAIEITSPQRSVQYILVDNQK